MIDPARSTTPFPAVAGHAAIGDRRTGALAAADGTLDWWCLPDFDGPPLFASLLDPTRGGFCRWGPAAGGSGGQEYLPKTTAAVTRWTASDLPGEIEVTDVMAWPEDERPGQTQGQRVILRRLRVSGSAARVRFDLRPRWNFGEEPTVTVGAPGEGLTLAFAAGALGLWTGFPVAVEPGGAWAEWTVPAGEEHWVVLGWNVPPAEWSAGRAAGVFAGALAYWRDWSAGLDTGCAGECADAAERSAFTVQLLSHARHSSSVAALTTSLPERLGGDRNYDYRFAWVRDGSLALALLARLGKADEVRCYLHWLAGLRSANGLPLQVVYGIDGRNRIDETTVGGVRGYADSLPVRVGNRAATQRQLGSSAFLTDCVRLYLEHGGELEPKFWGLIRRVAEYTARHWCDPDSGIWELEQEAHYVSSRVMAWVVLERAGWIAARTGFGEASELARWRGESARIHAEVMDRGWNESRRTFRQRYDSDALDASLLLIPLMRFLPPEHPRVVDTVAAIERELVVDGLVHRFDPAATLGGAPLPIGEFEGAFVPCVCWHAHALALLGRVDDARAILARIDAVAGKVGLFAEEMCARENTFLGNTPLLFSHVEYVRAAIAIHGASTGSPLAS